MEANHAYFIKGNDYVTFLIKEEKVSGTATPLTTLIPNLADFGFATGPFRATVTYGGKGYLFKGAEYVRINLGSMKVEAKNPISEQWHGMEGDFGTDLDAALNRGTGRIFFFKKDRYVVYDPTPAVDKVVEAPAKIDVPGWTNVEGKGFGTGINAAVNWNTGYCYLFKAKKYLKVHIQTGKALPLYPLDTVDDYWSGIEATGFNDAPDSVLMETTPTKDPLIELSDAFFDGVRDLAGKLHCQPVHLLGVWNAESVGVHAWNLNPKSKAAGICQAMAPAFDTMKWMFRAPPATPIPAGERAEAFSHLTAEKQLIPYITDLYLASAGKRLDSPERIYHANFLPSTLTATTGLDDTIVAPPDPNYEANKILDVVHDDLGPRITQRDLAQVVKNAQSTERWRSIVKRLGP